MAASASAAQPAPEPTPRRRLSADQRRRAVLDAARTVFAQRGYHGASTAEIAERCCCSEPILYRHFPSKQALFAATLVDSAELLRGIVAPIFADTADPLEALAAVAEAASRDELFLEVSRLRILAVTLDSEPAIRDALATLVAEMHAHLTGLMARARDLGTLRADIDPADAAWLWYGFALQAGVRRTLFGAEPAPATGRSSDRHDGGPQRTGVALINLLTATETRP